MAKHRKKIRRRATTTKRHSRVYRPRKKVGRRVQLLRHLVARGYTPKRALAILRRYERYTRFKKHHRKAYRVSAEAFGAERSVVFTTRSAAEKFANSHDRRLHTIKINPVWVDEYTGKIAKD